MGELWQWTAEYLREGGAVVYLLQLPVAFLVLYLLIERSIRLFFIYPRRMGPFLEALERALREGRKDAVLRLCAQRPGALVSRLVVGLQERSTLDAVGRNGRLHDQWLELRSLPFHRLETLRGLAYVAMLASPLATLIGRVEPFYEFGLATPEQKAMLLLRGQAEAMQTTVGWCVIALAALVGTLMLEARARRLHADLTRIASVLRAHLELAVGVPRPEERRTVEEGILARRRRLAPLVLSPGPSSWTLAGRLPALGAFGILLWLLVFFMVRVWNTGPAANLTPGLSPPVSISTAPFTEGVCIAMTRARLEVDDRVVTRFGGSALSWGQVDALKRALEARLEHHRKVEQLGGARFEGRLLLVADRRVASGPIIQVLEVAARVGFDHPVLVVVAP